MKQAFDKDDISQRQDRLLTTLEGLLELSATEVKMTLDQATSLIAEVLAADKVDLFFHDPASATLVALGTSDTPLGRQQRAIGIRHMNFHQQGAAGWVERVCGSGDRAGEMASRQIGNRQLRGLAGAHGTGM